MKQVEIFKSAKFIKASKELPAVYFRGTFCAAKNERTVITACGLGFYRLYINGKPVSNSVFAPVTSFYHKYDSLYCAKNFGEELSSRIYCNEYDITELVRDGENVIAAEVGLGWYADYEGECVFCCRVQNGENEFYSDGSFKWLDAPLTEYRFTKGEAQDYLKHEFNDDWKYPGFDCGEWRNVCETELPETEYYIQNCPDDIIVRSLTPKKIYETDEYFVYDAGENISGRVVFTCPEKGKDILLTVGEYPDENGDLEEKHIHGQYARFICDGTDREYMLLFTWHAFRYFRLPKCAEVQRVEVIHSDIAVTSDFKCENDVLNTLYSAYIRTQLCNMHAGIPSDCPHLERRGYTGDGQLTCEAVMMMLDTEVFYRKWIKDIGDCQDKNSGHVQYTAPYTWCGGGPGGWGCAIAEVPYVFYKMFGDPQPAKEHFDGMLHYLDYLEAHSENDLVISDQPGLWCLGEWCTPSEKHGSRPEIPAPFVNNYFYIKTIDRIIELAPLCGRAEVTEHLSKVRKIKVDAVINNYFDAATGDFCQNKNSANAFACDIGLGDERTFANLIKKVRTEPLDTGIFGTDLVPSLLFKNGYFDEAVEFLSRTEYPSFGQMFKNGATTLWEDWHSPRSMSHPMFGSCVKYLFKYILGIRQTDDSVAYNSVIIEPHINAVTGSAAGYITTRHGRISVNVQNGKCAVTVPEGIKADVRFDGEIELIKA